MKSRVILVVCCFLFLCAFVYAQEPWKAKPYSEWNEEEVAKVMNDSPWSRQVSVTASWKRGQSNRRTASGGRSTGAEPATIEDDAPQATYNVRWASAATIRRAFVRGSILRGRLKEEEGANFLSQEPQEYEIVVMGQDMYPFNGVEEADLLGKAFIKPKSGKLKLAPTHIKIDRAAPDRVRAVTFYFAKKSPAGEAVIPSGEKGIEFTCGAGGVGISTTFDPRKMVAAGTADY
jgi:hypothetical protein